MMKIKYLLIGLLSAMTMVASAKASDNFAGWFGSVALNGDMANNKIDNSVHYYLPNYASNFQDYNGSVSAQKMNPKLYVDMGYSWVFKNYYLGLSVAATFQPASTFNSPAINYHVNTLSDGIVHNSNGFASEQNSISYDLAIMPGYVLTEDSLAYLKLAVSSSTYQNTIRDSYYINPMSDPSTRLGLAGETTSATTMQAYSIGLGYEKKWRAKWSIFAELNYQLPIQYTVSRTVKGTDSFDIETVRNESYTVTYSGYDANIGLRYRF